MNLTEIMDELGTALDVIPGLHVVPYPDGKINVPCAFVGFPDRIDYDANGPGQHVITLPVVVLVSLASERQAWHKDLPAVVSDGGIKTALETHAYTTVSDAYVPSVEPDVYDEQATQYAAAIFTVQVGV